MDTEAARSHLYFKLGLGLIECHNVATTTATITTNGRSRAVKEEMNTIQDSSATTLQDSGASFKVAATTQAG